MAAIACLAGKYRTAAVTKEGDVFMWEGWSQPLHAGSGASGRLGTPQLPPAPPPGSSPGTSASLQVRTSQWQNHSQKYSHNRFCTTAASCLQRVSLLPVSGP